MRLPASFTPAMRHPQVLPADQRHPGYVGKSQSTSFLNSMNPVLYLVFDIAVMHQCL